MLLKRECGAAGGLKILRAHAEARNESPGGVVEEMNVPHDVHVTHSIEVVFRDGGLMRGGERGQVHCGDWNHRCAQQLWGMW